MNILRLLALWFLAIGTINAQEKVSQIARLFEEGNSVEWSVPAGGKNIALKWYQRNNSLAQEGFRTFVAYYNGAFAGSISLNATTLSGEVWHEGKTYFLSSEKGVLKVSTEKSHFSCGTCADGHCNTAAPRAAPSRISSMARSSENTQMALPSEDQRVLYNSNVLRTFRLAMLIDYSFFVRHCQRDVAKAKAFMTEVQTGLNEVCGREIGCQFELVNDPRLIITTKEKEVYDFPTVRTAVERATGDFNSLIGEENYDAGIVFSVYKDNRGLAHLGEITGRLKGGCIANHEFYIILHELGHLLGSAHTFTIGGQTASSFTEPDRGNSIMSYINDPYGTYFSLPSIYTIRNRTNLHDAYYSDKERTQLVGLPQANIPYGEVSDNRAPVINRSALKKNYKLPPNTYFQFTIEASDPDGDPLLYMAHQADFLYGKARFPSNRPTESNRIEFYQPYKKNGGTNEWEAVPFKFTKKDETGDFTFWLGVSDGKVGAYKNGKPHATLYDVYETKVNIVDGTPFRITNVSKSSAGRFKYGKETTIFWNVDKNIFGEDSKVRILFSDDYGKSYKYVLAEGIPNNGKATVIFPVQARGWNGGNLFVEGLFKIEVIDHIAYAVHTDTPGTLDMHSPDITFKNLPEPTITVKKGQVPEAPTVTAVANYCPNKVAQVTFTEEDHTTYLLRKWVASDQCNRTATAQQFIYYEKDALTNSLHFVGDLPKDMHVQCKGEIPEKAEVKAEGADNIHIDYEEEMKEGDKKSYKFTRSWIAYADGALPIKHTQQIFLKDTQKPELSSYPKSMTVKSEDEVPLRENLTATDNCGGVLEVTSSEESKYDKNGKKIEVRYTWYVEDSVHNKNRYQQIITINPNPTITTPTVTTPTVTTPTVTTPMVTTPTVSTPTVTTPTVSTPTVSTPTVSTPTVSTPTVSTPTVTTPTVNTPTVSTPTVSTPTVSTPTVSTPTVSTPTVSTPTVSTPTVSTPTVSTPTVSTPTVSTPTVSTPTVTTPTVSTPTVSTPTVTTPTVTTPTVTTPMVSTPTVTTPTVTKPTVSTPTVTTPTVSTPTVTTPTVSTPTVTTPTVSTPTVSTPTVSTPTVSTPTVSTPTVSTPTVSTPMVSTPTVSTPTVSTPTVTTPTVSTPTVSTPTVSTPTVTTPTVSTPTVSTPTVTTPTVTTPTVSTPTVTTPTVSTPTVTTPTVSTPTVTTPTVSTPTVSTPTVSTPTVSTPTVSTPTVSTPTVSTPTVSTPTVNSPTIPDIRENTEIIIYNGISTTDPRNYFKIENVDIDKPISVIIFDEMGLKVYESDHYQEKGEIFRGYANVKNIIGSKPLAGTFFYVLRYYKNNKLEEKKGFLYVR